MIFLWKCAAIIWPLIFLRSDIVKRDFWQKQRRFSDFVIPPKKTKKFKSKILKYRFPIVFTEKYFLVLLIPKNTNEWMDCVNIWNAHFTLNRNKNNTCSLVFRFVLYSNNYGMSLKKNVLFIFILFWLSIEIIPWCLLWLKI